MTFPCLDVHVRFEGYEIGSSRNSAGRCRHPAPSASVSMVADPGGRLLVRHAVLALSRSSPWSTRRSRRIAPRSSSRGLCRQPPRPVRYSLLLVAGFRWICWKWKAAIALCLLAAGIRGFLIASTVVLGSLTVFGEILQLEIANMNVFGFILVGGALLLYVCLLGPAIVSAKRRALAATSASSASA